MAKKSTQLSHIWFSGWQNQIRQLIIQEFLNQTNLMFYILLKAMLYLWQLQETVILLFQGILMAVFLHILCKSIFQENIHTSFDSLCFRIWIKYCISRLEIDHPSFMLAQNFYVHKQTLLYPTCQTLDIFLKWLMERIIIYQEIQQSIHERIDNLKDQQYKQERAEIQAHQGYRIKCKHTHEKLPLISNNLMVSN